MNEQYAVWLQFSERITKSTFRRKEYILISCRYQEYVPVHILPAKEYMNTYSCFCEI